jgi:hypothetical protein
MGYDLVGESYGLHGSSYVTGTVAGREWKSEEECGGLRVRRTYFSPSCVVRVLFALPQIWHKFNPDLLRNGRVLPLVGSWTSFSASTDTTLPDASSRWRLPDTRPVRCPGDPARADKDTGPFIGSTLSTHSIDTSLFLFSESNTSDISVVFIFYSIWNDISNDCGVYNLSITITRGDTEGDRLIHHVHGNEMDGVIFFFRPVFPANLARLTAGNNNF